MVNSLIKHNIPILQTQLKLGLGMIPKHVIYRYKLRYVWYNKVILILLSSLILRLIAINQSLWLDEAISALAAKNYSLVGLVIQFSPGDTHPPLYYLVLRAWALIFGFSEASLRAPSVIFGVLSVFIVYKIGKIIGGRKFAITAALFMATAPLSIYYSQEARMYAASTFAVSLAFYTFLKKNWPLFSLSILLVGLFDYLPLLILVPLGLIMFLATENKKFRPKFLAAHIPLAFFSLLWLPTFVKQATSSATYLAIFPQWESVLGSANIKDLALVWVKFIIGRISIEPRYFYATVVIFSSIFFIVSLFRAAVSRKKVLVLWFWLLIPLILAIILSFWIPGFSYFRLTFLLPAFYLLTAYGTSKLSRFKLFTLCILILNIVFSSIYLFDREFQREDWRGLVSFIEAKIKKDEIVLVSYPEAFAAYQWYSKKLDKVYSFGKLDLPKRDAFYTLDYLMDLTDPQRRNYEQLKLTGFKDIEVFNFRGVGQVRYWRKI